MLSLVNIKIENYEFSASKPKLIIDSGMILDSDKNLIQVFYDIMKDYILNHNRGKRDFECIYIMRIIYEFPKERVKPVKIRTFLVKVKMDNYRNFYIESDEGVY